MGGVGKDKIILFNFFFKCLGFLFWVKLVYWAYFFILFL